MLKTVAAISIALAGLALPHSALAADLDSVLMQAPELPTTKPVEVGTGWYLRGDVGYSIETSGDADSKWSGSGGFGYHFNDFVRSDLTVEYNKGSFSGAGSQDFTSYGFMLNGYFDLGTYVGITPYVGGGVGYMNSGWDDYTDGLGVTYNGVSDWRFAYQLSAGLAYNLTRNLKLDVGYRYLKLDGGERYVDALGARVKDDGFSKNEIRAGLRYDIW